MEPSLQLRKLERLTMAAWPGHGFRLVALVVAIAIACMASRAQAASPAQRLWIDTDAACGLDARSDPDDCFALVLALTSPRWEVVGISTVFGNAPLHDTDRVTREIVAAIAEETGRAVPVYRGADTNGETPRGAPTPAASALAHALADGPLTILALGPVTNIAQALAGRSELGGRVQKIVAVMGKRKGHIFHPAEGAEGAAFFGHGPIFTDLNFCKDKRSAAALLAAGLPAVLVPYEAARQVSLTGEDIETMAGGSGVTAQIAERSRGWLDFWRSAAGRNGFYPFDLVAAAYLESPDKFQCTPEYMQIDQDVKAYGFFGGPTALMIADRADGSADSERRSRWHQSWRQSRQSDRQGFAQPVLFCSALAGDFHDWLTERLGVTLTRARAQ